MANDKIKVNGGLFNNLKKETKKQPDYTGVINATEEFAEELYKRVRRSKGEVKLQISGWIKEPKDPKKKKYISMNIDFGQDKDQSDDRGRGNDRSRGADFDDEIPF